MDEVIGRVECVRTRKANPVKQCSTNINYSLLKLFGDLLLKEFFGLVDVPHECGSSLRHE